MNMVVEVVKQVEMSASAATGFYCKLTSRKRASHFVAPMIVSLDHTVVIKA